MLQMLAVFVPAVVAGIVQGVSGFGFGVVVMMVYPFLMRITDAAFLCQSISAFMCLSMVIRYHSHIRWRRIVLPLAFYFPLYFLFLHAASRVDVSALTPGLGLVLIALSLYFLFLQGHFSLQPTWYNAFFCALVSAALDGFFGIGGPAMVLYFLSASEDKKEYLGTVQTFFLTVCIYGTALRLARGMAPDHILQTGAACFAGMLVGTLAAGRIVNRLDSEKIKKIVYIVIGVAGTSTLLTSLI